MTIGITGTDGAGKGTVVDYLVSEKGFVHYSARAIWESEFLKRGMESNRANMRTVANELRAKYGNDFLITYYLQKIEEDRPENVIIESIRATAEANTLKAHGGILLSVDADTHIRFERIKARGTSSDNVTFEEFVALEEREMDDPDPNGMQKARVMEMADFKIENNISKEDLYSQVEEFLAKFGF